MTEMPTLKNEFDMLVGELRQNRQIQLQAFFAAPIWVSLFFGLVASGSSPAIAQVQELALLPIPLLLANLLLILDRRKSSDVIIAYFRTAFDERLAIAPGWNLLLPAFRRNLSEAPQAKSNDPTISLEIPHRFDLNVIVLLSYFLIASSCVAIYWILASRSKWVLGTVIALCVLSFGILLYANLRWAQLKPRMISAWRKTLKARQLPAGLRVEG
jgi:hypothetical protein